MTHKNLMRSEEDAPVRSTKRMYKHHYANTNPRYRQENNRVYADVNQQNILEDAIATGKERSQTIQRHGFTNIHDIGDNLSACDLQLRDVIYADMPVCMLHDLEPLSRKLNDLLQREGISPIIRDKILPIWMNELQESMLAVDMNNEPSRWRTPPPGISDLCVGVVPQDALHLPEHAPELYDDRPIDLETGKRETIIRFLERVWRDPWITNGILTRPDFRRLDPKGDIALQNWLRKPENTLPAHLHIPKKSEVIDDQLGSAEKMREAWRLAAAHRRRQSKPQP